MRTAPPHPPSCLQDFQVDHKLIRKQVDEAQAGRDQQKPSVALISSLAKCLGRIACAFSIHKPVWLSLMRNQKAWL